MTQTPASPPQDPAAAAAAIDGPSPSPTPGAGVTVVIPALNEEAAMAPTLEALTAMAQGLDGPCELLVVDDGSSDRTGDIARALGARVLRHPQPGGYGHALKTGIRAATYDRIAITDADGTYPVEEIPRLLGLLDQGHTMVVGARTGRHFRRPGLGSPLRALFHLLASFVTGTRIPDPNSGLRVFRKADFLPILDRLPRAFSFTTTSTVILILSGAFVHFTPIAYHQRIGRSKVRLLRDALRVGQTFAEAILTHNPLKLFLLLAMVPALGAVVALVAASGSFAVLLAVILATGSLTIFALGMLAVVVLFHVDRR